MTTNLNVGTNDLELEYQDAIKDPNNPEMASIEQTIPEKYKGKSADDLINMHVNLEKVLRRQGSELGQLRKVVDAQTQLISTRQIASNPQTEVKELPPITAEKLLNDPNSAVRQAVQPVVDQTNSRVDNLERQVQQTKFEQANPSYMTDVQDPEFQNWVLASKIRSKLLVNLHNKYDFESGAELWELWNEHKGAKDAAEQARVTRISQASTIKSGAAEPRSKPLYSRAKLAQLQLQAERGDLAAKAQWEDPEFQREYLAAYNEDRIR